MQRKISSLIWTTTLLPILPFLSSCSNKTNVIGYANVDSFTISSEGTPDGEAMITGDPNTYDILDGNYPDLRFDTLTGRDDTLSYVDWTKFYLNFNLQIHFNKDNFDNQTWSWISQVGNYSLNNGLPTFFNPLLPAHFQFYINCYEETSPTIPQDPYSYRTQQISFILGSTSNLFFTQPPSTSSITQPTTITNEYLNLKIANDNNEIDWDLTWIAPFYNFMGDPFKDDGAIKFDLYQFKLMTENTDDSQIITPEGKIIGFKYSQPPKNVYFALKAKAWGGS